MTPREKESAKDKLLNAALNVVRCKGYASTTVDDLCEAAGVTKGAFFHHFKSKEELAVAAARHWSKLTDALFAQAPYRAPADPRDRVLGYVDYRRELVQGKTPEFTCLVGTMVQETYDSNPAIRDACRDSIFGHAADVAKDLQAAKDLYARDADWSVDQVALHTQAVIQGAFILAKASDDLSVAVNQINHLRRYLELLLNKKPSTLKTKEKAV